MVEFACSYADLSSKKRREKPKLKFYVKFLQCVAGVKISLGTSVDFDDKSWLVS